MNTKHTPGPWRMFPNRGQFGVIAGLAGSDSLKAIVPQFDGAAYGYTGSAELEANARLIAAAPELLEALQSALDALRLARTGAMPGMAEIDNGAAAIAKATGKTA